MSLSAKFIITFCDGVYRFFPFQFFNILLIIYLFHRLLTKHFIQISTECFIFGHLFALNDTASIIYSTITMVFVVKLLIFLLRDLWILETIKINQLYYCHRSVKSYTFVNDTIYKKIYIYIYLLVYFIKVLFLTPMVGVFFFTSIIFEGGGTTIQSCLEHSFDQQWPW